MSVSPKTAARKTAWPEPAQFNEAVQNLASSVSDRELQGGEAELGPLGLPMPYAGNFADVYKVYCPATGNTWAVKFFKREVRDLRERYQAISDQLVIAQLPFTTEFRYLEQGVRIGGAWYPLVKMRWIEGLSLNRFVAQSLFQPKMLDQLFDIWIKVASRLRAAGVAHADLQHGNVVLVPAGDNGRLLLKLIDYDGMYVPALAGQKTSELGHANYQHPQRAKTGAFNAELDRFSHLAICCALRGLSAGGLTLWERFNNEENLLFTAQDFADPSSSKLFRELWMLRHPDAKALAGHLALATQRPLEQAPLIDELVRDGRVRPLTAGGQRQVEQLLFQEPAEEVLRIAPEEPRAAGTVLPSIATAAALAHRPATLPTHMVAQAERREAAAKAAAEARPPFTLASLLIPFLAFDRLLGQITGPEHLLLHNFLRVMSLSVAVGVGPAVYYAATRPRPAPVVVAIVAETPPPDNKPPIDEVETEPEPEPNPEPESTPAPEPDALPPGLEPDPYRDPPPQGFPSPTEPQDPSYLPPEGIEPIPDGLPGVPVAMPRVFGELPHEANGISILPLPEFVPGKPSKDAVKLAQLHLERPEDLQMSLLGSHVVFPFSHGVSLARNFETGDLPTWDVTCVDNVRLGVQKPVQLAQFTLADDGGLLFRWANPTQSGDLRPSALRYCALSLQAGRELAICALSHPVQVEALEVSFSETGSAVTLPVESLDTASLPESIHLRVTMSLAGRLFQPALSTVIAQKGISSSGSELLKASSLAILAGEDATLGPALRVRGAFGFDREKPESAKIVIAPEMLKPPRKPEEASFQVEPATLARIAKFRDDCDADISKLIAKRESKRRVQESEKWYAQLAQLEQKMFEQQDLLLVEQLPRKFRAIEKNIAKLSNDIAEVERQVSRREQENLESVDAETFLQTNRDRCEEAHQVLSELQDGLLDVRVFYEIPTPAGTLRFDVLRIGEPQLLTAEEEAAATGEAGVMERGGEFGESGFSAPRFGGESGGGEIGGVRPGDK